MRGWLDCEVYARGEAVFHVPTLTGVTGYHASVQYYFGGQVLFDRDVTAAETSTHNNHTDLDVYGTFPGVGFVGEVTVRTVAGSATFSKLCWEHPYDGGGVIIRSA